MTDTLPEQLREWAQQLDDGQGFKFPADSVRRALKDVTITVTP